MRSGDNNDLRTADVISEATAILEFRKTAQSNIHGVISHLLRENGGQLEEETC